MNKKFYLLLLTTYLLLTTTVFAKNKVISKSFNWQVFQTEHFDVYFYDEGKNILPEFTTLIEKIYRE
ncbi:MAG: hypothetical protein QME68_06180, partial [Elusimicrobiota bacterium]|nr:hypothetical protein [Elusimicrobiota bacterium]